MNKDTIKVKVYLVDGTIDEFYANNCCDNNSASVYWFSSEKNEYYTYPYAYIKKFVETDFVETDTEPE